jgi:hypothetical protein
MIFEELKLSNPGILLAEIPSDILENLKQDVDKQSTFKFPIKEKVRAHNRMLAGQIEKEYSFDLPKDFEIFLSEFYSEYSKYFNVFNKLKIHEITSWLNIQQKNEYNPNHTHSANLSWVVWTHIPYSLADEDNMTNTKRSNAKANSRFEFIFSKLNGEIIQHKLEIDKTWEGKIIMFPSYLMHTVYPFFTSDDYRISISGNILLSPNI